MGHCLYVNQQTLFQILTQNTFVIFCLVEVFHIKYFKYADFIL